MSANAKYDFSNGNFPVTFLNYHHQSRWEMDMRFDVRGWLTRWLLVGLSCCLLAGCSLGVPSGKVLRVATEPAFPPFEFQDKGRELKGFSIDLMRAIAIAANFQVDFQSLPFDGIIPALQAKTIDAAISSITITQDRANTVAFSRPYFKAGLAIAIRADNSEITDFSSLKNKKLLSK